MGGEGFRDKTRYASEAESHRGEAEEKGRVTSGGGGGRDYAPVGWDGIRKVKFLRVLVAMQPEEMVDWESEETEAHMRRTCAWARPLHALEAQPQ